MYKEITEKHVMIAVDETVKEVNEAADLFIHDHEAARMKIIDLLGKASGHLAFIQRNLKEELNFKKEL